MLEFEICVDCECGVESSLVFFNLRVLLSYFWDWKIWLGCYVCCFGSDLMGLLEFL